MNLYCSGYTEDCEEEAARCMWLKPKRIIEWCGDHRKGNYTTGIETHCGRKDIDIHLISEFEFKFKQAVRKGKKNG